MTASEKECVSCPWWHPGRGGPATWRGCCKENGEVRLGGFPSLRVWESHQKGKCLFLPALHPHTPHYFSRKSQEAWEFYLQIQPSHFSLFDLTTRFQTSLVVQWLRLCTSTAEDTVQYLGREGEFLHVMQFGQKRKNRFIWDSKGWILVLFLPPILSMISGSGGRAVLQFVPAQHQLPFSGSSSSTSLWGACLPYS